ncbi:MAG: hypothetical protein JKY60_00970 [Kordiimonadaceae bacterium]|nr:hypothetical protein [Kordiimonadaceae bacterium]
MGLFITIGVTVIWYALMHFVSKVIFANSKARKDLKKGLLTFVLTVAPFAQEIYIYYGFQAYCDVYGGMTKLDPVYTNSLTANTFGANHVRLLAHPSLRHVLRTSGSLGPRPLSLVEDPVACDSTIHKQIVSSARMRRVVKEIQKMGLCYSDAPLPTKPNYLLRGNLSRASDYKPSRSAFFVRWVREGDPLELVDLSDNTVKSRFASWFTRPGFLMGALIPLMDTYQCSSGGNSITEDVFPFGSDLYLFLQKAILEKPANGDHRN